MNRIQTYRVAHLLPFLDVLEEIGAPLEQGLRQFKLPTLLHEQPDALLPVGPTLGFLSTMARKEGIVEMGLCAVKRVALADFDARVFNGVCGSPALLAGLQSFCKLAPAFEDTSLRFRIDAGETAYRISCTGGLPSHSPGLRHSEWGNVMALIVVVRAFAGSSWSPAEIAFSSPEPLSRDASETFPNTRLLVGQEAAWITVPRRLLSLAAPSVRSRPANPNPESGAELVDDPLRALRCVLTTYLGQGYPTIAFAAELAGMSVRSFQRKLGAQGLTYSDLVQQARFNEAARLLRTTEARMLEIALHCGYNDPSHFSRAFRCMSGVSPREFRAGNTEPVLAA